MLGGRELSNTCLIFRKASVRRSVRTSFRKARGGCVLVAAANNDVGFGEVGPTALLVEAGKGADGAKDSGRSNLDVVGLFDEMLDNIADIAAACRVKTCGTSVAIERVGVGHLEEAANVICAVPVKISVFNFFKMGMAAEIAFA